MARQLEGLGVAWQWVDGTDARQAGVTLLEPRYVTPELLASASGSPTPERGVLRPGNVACALGHKAAYERLLASGEPCGLVLEDDVDLPVDLGPLAEEVAAHMDPTQAEVTLLNFHRPGGLEVRRRGASLLRSSRLLATPTDLEHLSSGAAYLITAEAARRLSAYAFPMKAFSDEWGSFVRAAVLDQVRIVTPMPVRQNPLLRTTIDYYPPGGFQWWLRELAAFLGLEHLPGFRTLAQRRRLKDMETWGALGRVEIVNEASPLLEEPPPSAGSPQATGTLRPRRAQSVCR